MSDEQIKIAESRRHGMHIAKDDPFDGKQRRKQKGWCGNRLRGEFFWPAPMLGDEEGVCPVCYARYLEHKNEALQAENALLKTGVAEAIKAITSLPIDALGTGYTSATGEPYPIRDELLDALLSLLTPLERKQLLEE